VPPVAAITATCRRTSSAASAAARDEAVRTSGEILRDGAASHLWSGKPWRMWVTQADGGGKTLFTLTFHATHGDGQP
jgi:hypothetical protein